MVGTGLGAKRGILFKNAVALEQVATLDTVVFDKTGTLTRGAPEVVEIKMTGALDEQTLLRLAAALERESEHPLAEAIVKAARARGLADGDPAAGFEAVAGEGALATVEGRRLAVGNARLLEREHVALDGFRPLAQQMAGEGRTVVHVAVNGQIAGLIAVADAPRDTAREAITALHALGVRPVMLTGDNRATLRQRCKSAAAQSGRCARTSTGRSATTRSRCRSPPASSSRSGSRYGPRSAQARCPGQASSAPSTRSPSNGCGFRSRSKRRLRTSWPEPARHVDGDQE